MPLCRQRCRTRTLQQHKVKSFYGNCHCRSFLLMWIVGLNYPALRSNYPAVLYGIMGNLLEIGVATYTDGPYYNLLFSERLQLGFHSERNLLRLARAFTATRRVIADLREFYKAALPAPGSIAHLFPSPLPVPTYTGVVPSLTFTRRLSRSGEIVVLAGMKEHGSRAFTLPPWPDLAAPMRIR